MGWGCFQVFFPSLMFILFVRFSRLYVYSLPCVYSDSRVLNNVGLAAQHQNTVFPEFLSKYCYLSVHNYWSSFKTANYYKVFRLTFLLLLCLPNMILDKFWGVGSLHVRSKIIKWLFANYAPNWSPIFATSWTLI